MKTTELEKQPKSTLIEMIGQLQATVEALQAENEGLKERVVELEQARNRPAKTPQNSSVPPAAASQGEAGGQARASRPEPEAGRARCDH